MSAGAGRFVPLFDGLVSVGRLDFVDEDDEVGKVILSRTILGCRRLMEANFAIAVKAVLGALETL